MNPKINKWQEISRKTSFEKYGRKIEKVDYKLPDGKISDFYIRNDGIAAGILAITKDKKIIVVEEYRPGPNEILLELPGGFVDSKEKPENTIARELLEETGYSGKIQFVTRTLDDAYSTMDRYCYVATDCKKVCDPKPDDKEFMKVRLISIEKFRELLRSGRMTDIEVGYLCLDFLNLL